MIRSKVSFTHAPPRGITGGFSEWIFVPPSTFTHTRKQPQRHTLGQACGLTIWKTARGALARHVCFRHSAAWHPRQRATSPFTKHRRGLANDTKRGHAGTPSTTAPNETRVGSPRQRAPTETDMCRQRPPAQGMQRSKWRRLLCATWKSLLLTSARIVG